MCSFISKTGRVQQFIKRRKKFRVSAIENYHQSFKFIFVIAHVYLGEGSIIAVCTKMDIDKAMLTKRISINIPIVVLINIQYQLPYSLYKVIVIFQNS